MLKTIEGVIVSETAYGESSKILNILTRDGIIGVMSKGCKSIKSPLRNISNKLTYASYTIYYNEDKLSTLKEGKTINDFYKVKTDLELISYLTYITELVGQVMKQNNDPAIYDLYISCITKIDEGLNPMVMMNILEIKLLDFLGVGISLNGCAKCGSDKNIVTIDADIGGYVCKDCYTNEIIYDEGVRKMLRMYYLVDINSIKELKVKDYIVKSINQFLSIYYERYTGLYIHSRNFLNRAIEY